MLFQTGNVREAKKYLLTVFGHDEVQWPLLKKAPEFYG